MLKRIAFIMTIPAFVLLLFKFYSQDTVHIAFIGPLSGKSAKSGQELLNGAQLYVDHLNKTGGINNHKVVIDTYDDRGDPVTAKEQAEKIAKNEAVIGVIGHTSSDCVKSAGEVYQKHHLPTLLPCATNVDLVKNNKMLFRMIFNDSEQAEYMVLFAKHILEAKSVVILYSDTVFGNSLNQYLQSVCKTFGVQVLDIADVKKTDYKKYASLSKDTAVLLATSTVDSDDTIEKVRKYTESNVVGPDSVSAIFSEGVKDFMPQNVYAASPMLFELCGDAGEIFKGSYYKKYKAQPSWYAVYGHDCAKVLLDAVNDNAVSGSIQEIRHGIVKTLNTVTDENTTDDDQDNDNTVRYSNVSGQVKFVNQESRRSVNIALLKANDLVAASTQLKTIPNKDLVFDFDDLLEQGRVIVDAGNKAFYKTNIISTGININEISALNLEKGTYMLDFYMWLRYDHDVKDSDEIIFLNSVQNIKLPTQIEEDEVNKKEKDEKKEQDLTFAKLLAVKSEGPYMYKLFRIKNIFRVDAFKHARPAFYDVIHTIGVNFRHTTGDSNLVRFAKDTTGSQNGIRDLNATTAMFEKTGWSPIALSSYEDAMQLNAMGNPHYLNTKEDVFFSRFNAKLEINDARFSFFDYVSYEAAKIILLVSLALLTLCSILRVRFRAHTDAVNTIERMICGALLLSSQIIAMDYVVNTDSLYTHKYMINLAFDITWWLVFASVVNALCQSILWNRLEERTGKSVPPLLYWCVAIVVYTIAMFGIIAFVLDMPITSLLASTSLLMFLIVMAVQMNVSNIFSGIFLNVEGAFREGDWVAIEDDLTGWVVKTGWRSTSIKTERGNIVNVPNSKIAESVISNYNYPNKEYDLKLRVGCGLCHDPKLVKELLSNAVLQDEYVKNLEIIVKFYEGEAAIYELTMTVENYDDPVDDRTRDRMYSNIWKYMDKAGISTALRPSRDLFLQTVKEVDLVDIATVMQQSEIFKDLSTAEMKTLLSDASQFKLGQNVDISIIDHVLVVGNGTVIRRYDVSEEKKDNYNKLSIGSVIGLAHMQNLDEPKYVTITQTILIAIDIRKVMVILNKNAAFAEKVKTYVDSL